MSACSVSRLAKVPPDIAEALESLRAAWEQAGRDAQSSGQRIEDRFEAALRRSPALGAAMKKHGVLLDTSARMLRALRIPAAQVEALLHSEERQPVLWLLSSAVVLLCARDERVMMLEPPFALLGAEPPERARVRASAPSPVALGLYSWLDRVLPGFTDRKGLDLVGPTQAPDVLLRYVAEFAAEHLKAGNTAVLEDLWRGLETGMDVGVVGLMPVYDVMCWRAQYAKFDLELFRAQIGPRMKAELASFQRQRAEDEERAIREGSQSY